ncbi:Copine-8 [Aphelenchoides avenae]|nr:Copine-8 [Aphelenchus avenae]
MSVSTWILPTLVQLYSAFLFSVLAAQLLATCIRRKRRYVPDNTPNPNQAILKDLGPKATVELMLSARNLADKDILSKSDPMCVVYRMTEGSNGSSGYKEIGRTEVIKNCLNPQWSTKFELPYYFEQSQGLKFELYDIDSRNANLNKHDLLGIAETDLADVVAAPGGVLELSLSGVRRGQLLVRGEEVNDGQKEVVSCTIRGERLDKKDFCSKSDPFLEFYRLVPEGQRQLVHRTEVIPNTLNPAWRPMVINVRHLSKGNKDAEFEIDCFDHDNDGGRELIGSCRATVNGLQNDHRQSLPLINESLAKRKGAKYRNSGSLHFTNFQVIREYTFLEYIRGGLQLEFGVAVDFTASNGQVFDPSSLHFIGSGVPNQYETAIRAVLSICEHYNKKRVYDAVGFGAIIPPMMQLSHGFPLNLTTMQREVHDMQGVLQAYKECQKQVTLSGPTNFAPTINEFATKASQMSEGDRYQILLIITDGCITDMYETKAAIQAACSLPLSIIIVGVGNADFSKMDELDGDVCAVPEVPANAGSNAEYSTLYGKRARQSRS